MISLTALFPLAAHAVFFAATVALALADLRQLRLPDRLLLPTLVTVTALLGGHAALTGIYDTLQTALTGAALNTALHLSLYYAGSYRSTSRTFGFGDVKLAALTGLITGWHGYGIWVTALIASFIAAGTAAGVLLALRQINKTTRLPFGPCMLLATAAAIIAPPIP